MATRGSSTFKPPLKGSSSYTGRGQLATWDYSSVSLRLKHYKQNTWAQTRAAFTVLLWKILYSIQNIYNMQMCRILTYSPVRLQGKRSSSPQTHTSIRNIVNSLQILFHKYSYENLRKYLQLTANGWLVRIQYKCLVPIYVFPETKLLFPKHNYCIMFCLPVPTLIYLWEIYIFPWSVCLFCCREIWGPILRIYKLLTDTWMWKLGLRPRNSQKRNT